MDYTDAVIYELHVRDFSINDSSGVSKEYQGKFLAFTEEGTTLNGEGNISTCIDYLKELGVSVIYLCPIFEAYSNHKYDTGNYLKVDEMFGGEEALKNLIEKAKRLPSKGELPRSG